MAEEEDELPRCSTLFLTEDGSQMLFYMTPCTMKTRLRPLICHGGGVLSSKVHPDSIKLTAPGPGSNMSGYISSDYIFESIKQNKLQDVEQYRLKKADTISVKSSTSANKSVSSSTIKVSSRGRKNGRHAYTPSEDLALMDFVNENKNCFTIKGNCLYQRAEREKVTSHSWQSMRDHYIKFLHKHTTSKCPPLLVLTRKLKSSAGAKKDTEHKKETTKTPTVIDREQARMTRAQAAKMKDIITESKSKRAVTPDTDDYTGTDQARMTRAQASKIKEKIDSPNKHAATADADDADDSADQRKTTRAQASKIKEKIDSPNKHAATADEDSADNDQGKMTRAQVSKVKEKLDSPNKLAVTPDADDCAGNDQGKMTKTQAKVMEKIDSKSTHGTTDDCVGTDNLPDDANADNEENESTCNASDVDYDKMFDDNLLKQAYECKEKDGNEIVSDSTDDEDVAEENRISSSQKTVQRRKTRREMLTNEQEKMSDFEGEVVFKEDLKSSPSAKKVHSDEDKRPIAKRSRMDLESSPDHVNAAAKEGKEGALAFFNYYQALQSYIQRNSDLTVPQFIHSLLVNSGYLDDAENYFKNGTGKEQWALKEDKILRSKNKEEISSLAKKRGLHAVIERMNFMDGIN